MVARVAAVFALFAPIILWLLRQPLCGLANVEAVNAGSQACNGNPGNLVVTPSAAALAVVGIVTLIVLVKLLLDLTRPRDDGTSVGPRDLLPLAVTAVLGGIVIALARGLPTDAALISINAIVPEFIALLIAIPLALVGLQLITARDSRRFAAGFVLAAGVWFVVLYPNIAALPLPDTIVNAYQGLLPTYLYAFQFSVNTLDRSGAISFADARFVLLDRVPRRRLRRGRLLDVGVADGGRRGGRARAGRHGRAGGCAGRGLTGLRDEPEARRSRRPGGQATSTGASSWTTGTPAPVRGEGGTLAVKCGGRAPVAARRRIANP